MTEVKSMIVKNASSGHVYLHVSQNKSGLVFTSLRQIPAFRRFVFGAHHVLQKPSGLEAAVDLRGEIVVDLKVAETAAPASLEAVEGKVPWAPVGGLLTPTAFRDALAANVEAMADVVTVAQGTVVDAVLAPCHLVTKAQPEWLAVDIDAFGRLFGALQERQASRIAVNYLLITTIDCLRDRIWRREVVEALRPVPFHDLWLRIGGLGRGSEELAPEVLEILMEFQELGRPVILDAVGGVFGLLLLACGGVNAIAHGPGSREKCNLDKLQNKLGGPGGGAPPDLYVRDLFTYFTREQWDEFYAHEEISDHYSCVKTGCCTADDAVPSDKIGHFLRQRAMELETIAANAANSGQYFTGRYLPRVAGRASTAAKKSFKEPSITKALTAFSKTVETLQESLGRHRNGKLLPAPPHRALPGRENACRLYPEPYRPPRRCASDRQKPAEPPFRDPHTPELF